MKQILLLIVLIMSSACATIIQPGPDRVHVNSNPEGAKVYLDGQPIGVTPMVVDIARKSEGIIEIKKDGYEPMTVDRDKVASGWFFGNLLLGGVIGMGVDLATHNQGKYSEEPVFGELQEKPRKPASKP